MKRNLSKTKQFLLMGIIILTTVFLFGLVESQETSYCAEKTTMTLFPNNLNFSNMKSKALSFCTKSNPGVHVNTFPSNFAPLGIFSADRIIMSSASTSTAFNSIFNSSFSLTQTFFKPINLGVLSLFFTITFTSSSAWKSLPSTFIIIAYWLGDAIT